MIDLNLKIDDETVTFNIPDNWHEITIDQYAKYNDMPTGLTSVQQNVHVVNCLTHIDSDCLYQMRISDFARVVEKLEFMVTPVPNTHVSAVTIGNETYYVRDDFNQRTVGEIASAEMIMKEHDGNYLDAFPELLCILLRTKKENGKLKPFKLEDLDRAESFKSISIADVNQLFVFFQNGAKKPTKTTKPSLAKRKKKAKKKGTGSQT